MIKVYLNLKNYSELFYIILYSLLATGNKLAACKVIYDNYYIKLIEAKNISDLIASYKENENIVHLNQEKGIEVLKTELAKYQLKTSD